MPRQLILKALSLLIGAFILAGNVACSNDAGRVRVASSKVIGVYQIKFDSGYERLELQENGSFAQDFYSKGQHIHHSGHWYVTNHFLDGTDVVLLDALVDEEESNPRQQYGEVNLNVHGDHGKISLARNEAADWYYERI